MARLRRLFACALLVLLAGMPVYADPAENIVVYYSPQSEYQTQLAVALNQRIDKLPPNTRVRFITDYNLSDLQGDELIISLGDHESVDIGTSALKNDIVYVNYSKQIDPARRSNKNVTNIEITQPPCRHLNLINAINRQWSRIGYLASSQNDDRLVQLQECAAKLKLKIVSIVIDNKTSLAAAIDNILQRSDALLALPDNDIYNRHSVKNILLSSYRQRVPVFGFSDNFVSAGALAAVYSTPEQITEQIVVAINQQNVIAQEQIRKNIQSSYFSASINRQVAKALGLQISDNHTIESILHKLEGEQ